MNIPTLALVSLLCASIIAPLQSAQQNSAAGFIGFEGRYRDRNGRMVYPSGRPSGANQQDAINNMPPHLVRRGMRNPLASNDPASWEELRHNEQARIRVDAAIARAVFDEARDDRDTSQMQLTLMQQMLRERESELASTREELATTQAALAATEDTLIATQQTVENTQLELAGVRGSHVRLQERYAALLTQYNVLRARSDHQDYPAAGSPGAPSAPPLPAPIAPPPPFAPNRS